MQQALQPTGRILAPFQVTPPLDLATRLNAVAPTAARRALVGAFIALSMMSLVVGAIRAHPLWAPLDEGVHLDYVLKASRGQMVHAGDLIDRSVLRDVLCRGVDWPGWRAPNCGVDGDEFEAWAATQFNYVHVHPPVYYFLTAGASAPLQGLGLGVRDTVRAVDGIWTSLGLLFFAWIARREGVRPWAIAVLLLLLATTPVVLYASIAVTNDATSLLAGGLLLAGVLAWERSGRRLWVLPAAAALAVSLKATNLVAVFAAATYLMLRATTKDPPPGGERAAPAKHFAAAAMTVAGAIAVLVAWVVVRAPPPAGYLDPMQALFGVSTLTVADVAGVLPALVSPTRGSLVPTFLSGTPLGLATVAFGALLLVAAALAIVRPSASSRLRSLSVGALVGLVAGAFVVTLGNFLLQGVFLEDLPPRYGLSALPFLAVPLGAAMHDRAIGGAALVIATVSVIAVVGGVIGAI